LAKKNLLPVIARISDRLNKIVEFAKSLPEFMRLSLADQKALLTNACPRLLLLYMAETNLQFAVTTVPDAGIQLPPSASASNSSLNGASQVEWETPTMQFVECVQNFIRKCQTVGISANEYFYMRMITLFHTGKSLACFCMRVYGCPFDYLCCCCEEEEEEEEEEVGGGGEEIFLYLFSN